jgi:hypothetical protein
VVTDRTGEGALAVAEELRLDQGLRILRQVNGDEGVGEIGCEAAFGGKVGNES